jgi:hypothetical protein
MMQQRHSHACVRLASLCLVGMALGLSHARTTLGVEVGIGEATVPPGVTLVFEGARPDDITPHAQHLARERTDVHLEVRANWREQFGSTLIQAHVFTFHGVDFSAVAER